MSSPPDASWMPTTLMGSAPSAARRMMAGAARALTDATMVVFRAFRRFISIAAPLQEYTQIFVEQHIGVQHDRSLRHFPCCTVSPQYIVPASRQDLMVGLQV